MCYWYIIYLFYHRDNDVLPICTRTYVRGTHVDVQNTVWSTAHGSNMIYCNIKIRETFVSTGISDHRIATADGPLLVHGGSSHAFPHPIDHSAFVPHRRRINADDYQVMRYINTVSFRLFPIMTYESCHGSI